LTNIKTGLDISGGARALIKAQEFDLSPQEAEELARIVENRLNVYGIEDIKVDLFFANDYEIIIFGSYAGRTADKRSDIDIAIITREHDRQKCIDIWKETFGKAPDVYDIKIFELLPLQIKASAMHKFEVVFGNRLDISEYFYAYRKLWNDVKHRIETNRFSSMREKLILLKRWQKIYEKHI